MSPELALVDPELAERARVSLPTTAAGGPQIRTPAAPPVPPSARPIEPRAELEVDGREAGGAPERARRRGRRVLVAFVVLVLWPATVAGGYATAQWLSVGDGGEPASADAQSVAPSPEASATPAAPTDPPAQEVGRVFSWPPVDGAVAYRVEFFRGNEQVLAATTKAPRIEVPSSWRHAGGEERLSPGVYRWYVWPVRPGRGAKDGPAIVQARLEITREQARPPPQGAADGNPSIT